MKKNANQVFIDDDLIERLLRGEKPHETASAREPASDTADAAAPETAAASEEVARSLEESSAARPDSATAAGEITQVSEDRVAERAENSDGPAQGGGSAVETTEAEVQSQTGTIAIHGENAPEEEGGAVRPDTESVTAEVPRVLYENAESVSIAAPSPVMDAEPPRTALRELAESVSAEEFPKPSGRRRRPSFAGLFAKAVSLASQGRLDDAIAALEGSVADGEGGEDSADVHAGLGHLRFEQQDWAEAAQHYREVAKAEPQHATAHYNLALALERQGKFQEAAEAFGAALGVDAGRWQARLGRGLCLLHPRKSQNSERGDLNHTDLNHADPDQAGFSQAGFSQAEEALACLEAVEADGHGSGITDVVAFGKAVALQQLGRLADALALYQTLLPAHPEARDLVTNLLSIAAAGQDWTETEELARRLTQMEPHSVAALQALAAVETARGNYAAAVEHGRTLIEIAPGSYDSWFNLGLAHYALHDFDSAREAFEHALRIYEQRWLEKGSEPHTSYAYAAEGYANLGATLQALGEVGGASAAYARALELRPAMLGVLWNVGLLFAHQGDTREAERVFQRVAAIRPDWEDVTFRLGALQFERGDYASATDSFETFLADHTDWTDPRADLALCQWKLGQTEKAGATLAMVIQHDPGHTGALACLAALSLENVNEHDEEAARVAVVDLYRKVAGLGLASPELSFNAGVLLQAAGDPAAALPCFEDAVARKPEFGAALLNLGHVHQQMGDPEKAKAAWAKAIVAEPEFATGYFN